MAWIQTDLTLSLSLWLSSSPRALSVCAGNQAGLTISLPCRPSIRWNHTLLGLACIQPMGWPIVWYLSSLPHLNSAIRQFSFLLCLCCLQVRFFKEPFGFWSESRGFYVTTFLLLRDYFFSWLNRCLTVLRLSAVVVAPMLAVLSTRVYTLNRFYFLVRLNLGWLNFSLLPSWVNFRRVLEAK